MTCRENTIQYNIGAAYLHTTGEYRSHNHVEVASLAAFPTIKALFLKHNTSLLSSAARDSRKLRRICIASPERKLVRKL